MLTSSCQGFEVVKQLLEQSQPYRTILGARSPDAAQAMYDDLRYNRGSHTLTVLPLDLADLKGVKSFAQRTLDKLGPSKIDCLLLNAGMADVATEPGPHGSNWCETFVVNHLCKGDMFAASVP